MKKWQEIRKKVINMSNNKSNYPVTENQTAEFVGQIIDIFEDFLTEKNITLENPEKEENQDVQPDEEQAIIYSSDYGQLQTNLESMLKNWNIIK